MIQKKNFSESIYIPAKINGRKSCQNQQRVRMSSSKLSLCVEIELISIGVEEQRKGGKLKNALWRNEGNGSEWRNGITIKEMVRNLKKWKNTVGNGSELKNGRI